MTREEAIKQAVDILEEEANQVAMWKHKITDKLTDKDYLLPHRIDISTSREITRLREIARLIEKEETK